MNNPEAFSARSVGASAAADPAHILGSAVGEMLKGFSAVTLPLPAMAQAQADYVQRATELWNQALQRLQTSNAADVSRQAPAAVASAGHPHAVADRRFASPDWASNASAAYLAEMYLLNANTMMQMAERLEGDAKTRQRIRFAVQQWVDAAAPSNFLAFNPEAQRLALETNGESISQGMKQLWHDVVQGHVSQTDESVFEVGRNVATTEGTVVYENELIQLIEYRPLTAQVGAVPLLIVPPCINKYYILDLQPDNSLIRYAVAEGNRVFVISWRNADDSMTQLGWDDYVENGAIRAIAVAREIAAVERVNVLGFCVGGTILSSALAVLAARGQAPAASLTLLTSFLDFSDTGVLDVFIDEPMVRLREMTIGRDSPTGGGLLKGQELASTFSFLRPNDLVWNYVVGNYLKGETPPPFDLLYWNSDSTNLPGPMYCWYLRNTYLENNLMHPGRVTVCGEPVDLSRIDIPSFLYASREDHIVPWEGAYRSTHVLGGNDKRFVMGASGHIAGVINPPNKKKRSHWVGKAARLTEQPADWLAQAEEKPGSWWPEWADWLKTHAGDRVDAPAAAGNERYPRLEPAPGRYVRQKA